MLRILAMLWVAMIVVAAGPALADSPFNVDLFCGWDGCYRPMEWTPIEIGITTTFTEPFAGSVTVSAQQDGLNSLNIVHTFVLTPDVPLHLPLVTKLAFAADKCSVRIRDERGRTQWHQEFSLWDFSARSRLLTCLGENDLLIGLVGRRKFGLLRLAKNSICNSYAGTGKVYVADKLPRMVPWDWTGFVPLDILILYDPDWNLFNRHHSNAICQWVSNGGKLLLVLGSHPLPAASPLAQLLPFKVQQVRQKTLSTDTLAKWGLRRVAARQGPSSEPETVACWPLVPKPGARLCDTEIHDANECLFGTGYVGFGRVGVLAFDPSTMSEQQRVNSAKFWVGRIAAILEDTHTSSAIAVQRTAPAPPDYGGRSRIPTERGPASRRSSTYRDYRYYPMPLLDRTIAFAASSDSVLRQSRDRYRYQTGRTHVASNTIMEYLYNISEMRPLSIWWVILLLSALAILLGPVDYIVLKRKDRLPLTWLTCPFWIVVFSVGAYYGVQALRGGKMQLRAVSVLDGIADTDYCWSTCYAGLFAPRSDDYKLQGLQAQQWWSGICPTQGSMWALNREAGTRKIYCFQHDGGNLPFSLPINIWTVQCLLNESPLQTVPFTAEVEDRGDKVVLRITNEADSQIQSGYVLLGNRKGARFGSVAAHSTRLFQVQLRRLRVWDYNIDSRGRRYYSSQAGGYIALSSSGFRSESAFFAQGCLRRTQGMSAYLAHGAAVICTLYSNPDVSFKVMDRSCDYDHIQLARLVVFPNKEKKGIEHD